MYALAVLLVVAGVFAFYWFNGQWSTGLRIGAVVGGLEAALAVFMFSAKGRETREVLSESSFELRKVVWPTRQEANRPPRDVAGGRGEVGRGGTGCVRRCRDRWVRSNNK